MIFFSRCVGQNPSHQIRNWLSEQPLYIFPLFPLSYFFSIRSVYQYLRMLTSLFLYLLSSEKTQIQSSYFIWRDYSSSESAVLLNWSYLLSGGDIIFLHRRNMCFPHEISISINSRHKIALILGKLPQKKFKENLRDSLACIIMRWDNAVSSTLEHVLWKFLIAFRSVSTIYHNDAIAFANDFVTLSFS